VNECPTGAIHDVNFPTPAPVAAKPVAVKPETLKVAKEEVATKEEVNTPTPIIIEEPVKDEPKSPIKEIIEEIKEEVIEIVEEVKEEIEEIKEEIVEVKEEIIEEIKEVVEEIKEEIKEEKEEIKIDDFNNTPVSELIDESLRVKPREKKEPKQTKKANTNDNMQSLDF
jgi:gas vesicle protein